MPVNFFELFGLNQNFTKDELKKSLVNKIHYIDKLSISHIEKKYLVEMYHEQYNIAKNYLERKSSSTKPQNLSGFETLFDPKKHFDLIGKQQAQIFKKFDNLTKQIGSLENKSNVYISSYSYKSSLNPDGTKTVIESKDKFDNGKSDKKINSYIVDAQGNKKSIN